MKNDIEITFDDGKYTFIRSENGKQIALRYGEPWRDLTGDNLIYFMAMEILELRKQISQGLTTK